VDSTKEFRNAFKKNSCLASLAEKLKCHPHIVELGKSWLCIKLRAEKEAPGFWQSLRKFAKNHLQEQKAKVKGGLLV